MKPVNLIPVEQRRALRGRGSVGISLATRALLGVLALAVLAVGSLVLISNQVNSKKSEIADLTHKQEAATAASNALRPYGNFVKLQQARTGTVTGLARSRFNWERVLRQLSRTVPPKVWITSVSGTVSPTAGAAAGSSGSGGGGNTLRNNVQGPAVDLEGCAGSQADSARMIARMRALDDVSSVTLTRSELPDNEGGAAGGAAAGGSGGSEEACPRYQFDILVAFKADGAVASAPGAPTQTTSIGTTGTTGSTGPQGSTTGGTGQ